MNDTDRAEAMALRLWRAARRAHIPPDPIARAYRSAIERRSRVLSDPRHPDFLHPGRTALILIEDLDVADAAEIVAGVLYDSLYPEASSTAGEATALGGGAAGSVFAELVAAGRSDTSLAEDLITGSASTQRAALAERLDHARHLHLRDPSTWAGFHAAIRSTWLPLAERTHPVLARRYRWWTSMFARKYLGP